HVVGTYNDFFGGYYHNRDFGFGHWAPYDEMPGQKLWLWALSRAGGIWEDLLTDTDGQYIEFQAGRLFNQFSPGRVNTPITQADFEPGRADLWREIWFPVKEIGGLSDVSPHGVMHVSEVDDQLEIGINALEASKGKLVVTSGASEVYTADLELIPMGVKKISIKKPEKDFEIEVKGMDLHYSSKMDALDLDRDFSAREDREKPTVSDLYREGREELEFRNYDKAESLFESCLDLDPDYLLALNNLADIKLRRNEPSEALTIIKRAISLDTYDAEANFVAGKIYRALDDRINALECFGWAARSLQYRADAYACMGEIFLKNNELDNASRYARNALDYNRFHMQARVVSTIASRLSGNQMAAIRQISAIRAIDPLNHFAKMEQYLISKMQGDKDAYLESNRREFRYQTFLELAINYYNLGRNDDALQVLKLAPEHPMVNLWLAYLGDNPDHNLMKIADAPAAFVFPYRVETLKALEWASERNNDWKIKYYLALDEWGLGHKEQALQILNQFEETEHFAPMYQARAVLKQELGEDGMKDLEFALQIDKSNWRAWDDLLTYYEKEGMKEKFLVGAKEAYDRMPDSYVIEMLYANALIENKQYLAAVDILDGVQVLPFEGASLGHKLWEQANLAASIDFLKAKEYMKAVDLLNNAQKWPENLGVGKPYSPDLRVSEYLLGYAYLKLKKPEMAKSHFEAVEKYKEGDEVGNNINDLLNIKLAKRNGRSLEIANSAQKGRRGLIQDYLDAYQKNDFSTLKNLEMKNPELFSNLDFEIVKQALELD
ncbi:MAG: DUF5107 domain-containing protein, partial [Saprospiraceae bacterium]|nr:DUF5107 domain-containing protein [Saprospiraceae bacterium]